LRRSWVLLAAGVVVALVGVPALAVGFGVIDFQSSEPAPPRVVKDFASLSEAAPPGMDPAVLADQARQLTVSGHTLWIAPTRPGGLCYGWDGGSGGCDKLGTVPLGLSWLGGSMRVAPDASSVRRFSAVEGFAHAHWIDAVDVRLEDGTTVRPRLTWISEPIDAGFFYYVAPKGHEVVGVVGFRDGEAVASEQIGAIPLPHPYARLADRRELDEISTDAGPVRLWAAPTETDGRCVWLEFQGDERAVTPCLPRGYEREVGLAFALHKFGDTPILFGQCGYTAVELTGLNGTSRRVSCRDGVVFAQLGANELRGTVQAVAKGGNPLPGSRIEIARLQQ
jgi:hypothetical protein